MIAVYYGRSENMDLEDFLRSTPDELQHFGVKGMKRVEAVIVDNLNFRIEVVDNN